MNRYYTLSGCRLCGAVVLDQAAHDRWHAALPIEWVSVPELGEPEVRQVRARRSGEKPQASCPDPLNP